MCEIFPMLKRLLQGGKRRNGNEESSGDRGREESDIRGFDHLGEVDDDEMGVEDCDNGDEEFDDCDPLKNISNSSNMINTSQISSSLFSIPSSSYENELQQCYDHIKVLQQQLQDRDNRIHFLQSLLSSSHLSRDTVCDIQRNSLHHSKDLDATILQAVQYTQRLEKQIVKLRKRNKRLKEKLNSHLNEKEEIKILKQILENDEELDLSYEDQIEYLQSLTRRQYEYARKQQNKLNSSSFRESVRRIERIDETPERFERDAEEEEDSKTMHSMPRDEYHTKRSNSYGRILDEVRNVLDNFEI